MNHGASELKLPARPALYMRLSAAEYVRVASDAALTGRKMQDLVKEAYFEQRAPVTILVSNADYQTLMTALSKIGNNINQIAKYLNGGGKRLDSSVFEFLKNEILQLGVFFSSKYCRCAKVRGTD
jgi:hypothetical protein